MCSYLGMLSTKHHRQFNALNNQPPSGGFFMEKSKMKIKMITLKCGPDGNSQPGEELDVDNKHGKDLVDGNYAIEIKRKRGETQQLPAPENAMLTPTAADVAREHLANIAAAERAAAIELLTGEIASLEADYNAAADVDKPAIQSQGAAKQAELDRLIGA